MLTIATPDDLAAIYDLRRVQRLEEGVIGRVNEAKALGAISQHISQSDCLISRTSGEIVASVAIFRDAFWDTDDMAIFDRWFYVHPKHRSEGHATRMIAALKEVSRRSRQPLVLSVGTTPDALSRLKFFRKHLTPCGGAFLFNPMKEAA